MSDPAHVLVVAHQTAATPALLDTVRTRARSSPARFHLVVPRNPHGMHKLVDPQDAGDDEANAVLAQALPKLTEAAGDSVTGSLGDPEPLCAIQDAINLGSYDEIIISTLPRRVSRWLRLDLVSKTRGLGLPVTHVEADSRIHAPA
ncbi:MAG: hypothetical protein WAL63_16920 [Solirubrobacteraceae bacterium]